MNIAYNDKPVTQDNDRSLEKISAHFPDVSKRKWKAVSVYSKGLTTFHDDSLAVLDEISDITAGKMKIKLFTAGEFVPSMQVLDAVSKGSAEIGISDPKYWKGKDEAFVLINSISSCLANPLKEQQEAIRIACHNSVVKSLQEGPDKVQRALDKLDDRGVEISSLPPEIEEAHCRESRRYYDEVSRKHPSFGRLYRAYTGR